MESCGRWLVAGGWRGVQTVGQSDRKMIDTYRHQPATTDTDNYFNIYTSGEQGTTLHHLNNWTPQSFQTRRWWKTPSLSPYVVVHLYVHVCDKPTTKHFHYEYQLLEDQILFSIDNVLF